MVGRYAGIETLQFFILDLNGLVPDHKRTHKGHLVVQEELPKAIPELVSYLNSILASVPD